MSSLNEKVSRMFGSRFGTQLVIKWSSPQTLDAQNVQGWQTTFVYSQTLRQVSFPIFNSDNVLRAIAIASPVRNGDAVRFQEMSQFIQLTVKESLVARERLDMISNKEQVFATSHSDDSNVIRWPSKKESRTRPPETSEFESQPKVPHDFSPLWLFGDDLNQSLKVAFAAHEWVRNWAFMNVKEIPDLFWQKSDPWLSYPQMTILVTHAEELTPKQWRILEANVRDVSNSLAAKPLVIVTSRSRPEDLCPHFASKFKVYQTHSQLSPKAQAHFLLYQKTENRGWIYHCQQMKGLFFLPFGTTSDLLH